MRDKRDRFVELAQARVTKATQTIRLIGNLSNPNNYSYTEEDAHKILAALDGELLAVLALGALHTQHDLLGGLGLSVFWKCVCVRERERVEFEWD